MTPSAANVRSERPTILLLFLDTPSWFDEIYDPLITSLSQRVRLQRAKKTAASIIYLSENSPKAVLITDPAIIKDENSGVLAKLKEYILNGGTAVFMGLFSSFIKPTDLTDLFRTHFNLPWQAGDYHRTTFQLNSAAATSLQSMKLKPSYSQKAVHLKNVDPTAALYLPTGDSNLESLVFPSHPIENLTETPVAWTAIGTGWIGYIGDVNTEDGSNDAVLAMCRL